MADTKISALTAATAAGTTDEFVINQDGTSKKLEKANLHKFLADGSVTLAKLADMATDSFLGRTTAATGVPEVLSKADALAILNVEDGADVTDAANVVSSLNGATITTATVATGDKVLVQDADDSDNLKTVTAQSIADLSSGTARKFTTVSAASTTSTLGTGIANTLIEATNTITLTLPASLTAGVGGSFVIANVGTGVVTVSAGTDGINRAGNDSFTLAQDEWVEIVYASATDPKWTARVSETVTLAANQYSTLDSAGTSPEARTDKRAMTGSIVTDTNGTYYLGFVPFAGVATNVRARTISGTCDIVVSKNGSAINGFGSAVSITSTAGDTASTETFAADDLISVTTSSASTLTGVVLSLEFTRTSN